MTLNGYKVTDPAPGSLECWKCSPLERKDGIIRDEQFLMNFVLATFWIGGVAGIIVVGDQDVELLAGQAVSTRENAPGLIDVLHHAVDPDV